MFILEAQVFGIHSATSDKVKRALVIGNGESRKDINLYDFRGNHILIGCNAVHREYLVDILSCCDARMVQEALLNRQAEYIKIYTRAAWRSRFTHQNVHTFPNLPYQGPDKIDDPEHWGSGPYAVLLATYLGYKEVVLLGFDLYSKNDLVNNIYKGTDNYSGPEHKAVDHSFWVYQIAKVFEHNPDVHFTIVNDENWTIPQSWQLANTSFQKITDL